MENIENLKFMSIGGNCENIAFLGDQRIHGPIDNMRAVLGPKSGIEALLRPEEVYNQLISNNFTLTEKGERKVYPLFEIRHNDNTTNKFREELKRRFDNLISFYNCIYDENNYFVYSLNPYDVEPIHKGDFTHKLSKQFLEGVEELRKLNLLDKTIFVGSILEPFFEEKWFDFNSEEAFNIVGMKYIELKNIGLLKPEFKDYAHKQFLRELRGL